MPKSWQCNVLNNRKNHKEVLVKVNARVDQGIAPLVTALNQFSEIVTVDSCEGYNDKGYVYFCCQEEIDTVNFVSKLIKALRAHLEATHKFEIHIEWVGTEEPYAQIITSRDYLATLVSTLTAIRTSFLMARKA